MSNGLLKKTEKLNQRKIRKNNIRFQNLGTTYVKKDEYLINMSDKDKENNIVPTGYSPYLYSKQNNEIYIHSTISGFQKDLKTISMEEVSNSINEKINTIYNDNDKRMNKIKQDTVEIKEKVFNQSIDDDINKSDIMQYVNSSKDISNLKADSSFASKIMKEVLNKPRGQNGIHDYQKALRNYMNNELIPYINSFKNGENSSRVWNQDTDEKIRQAQETIENLPQLFKEAQKKNSKAKAYKTATKVFWTISQSIGLFYETWFSVKLYEAIQKFAGSKVQVIDNLVTGSFAASVNNKNTTTVKQKNIHTSDYDVTYGGNRLSDSLITFKIDNTDMVMTTSIKARSHNNMDIKTGSFDVNQWLNQKEENQDLWFKVNYLYANFNALSTFNSNSFWGRKSSKNQFKNDRLIFSDNFTIVNEMNKMFSLYLINYGFVANRKDFEHFGITTIPFVQADLPIDSKNVSPIFIQGLNKTFETWKIFKYYNDSIYNDIISSKLFFDGKVNFSISNLEKLYEFKRKCEPSKYSQIYSSDLTDSIITLNNIMSSEDFKNLKSKSWTNKTSAISMKIHLEEGE